MEYVLTGPIPVFLLSLVVIVLAALLIFKGNWKFPKPRKEK